MRTVTTALKNAIAAQSTGVAFVKLITITSANLTDPIRVADDSNQVLPIAGRRGIVSRGEEFVYLPFDFTLPNDDDAGIGRARISIDNISREIVQAIRESSGVINMKIEIVLSSDLDTPEVTLDNFVLESVNYDAFTISGDVVVQFFDLEPFPFQRFTPSTTPALF